MGAGEVRGEVGGGVGDDLHGGLAPHQESPLLEAQHLLHDLAVAVGQAVEDLAQGGAALGGAQDALLQRREGGGEEARTDLHLHADARIGELAEGVLDGGEDQGIEVLLDLAPRRQLAGHEAERPFVQAAEAAEGLEAVSGAGRGGDHLAALEEERAAAQVDPTAGRRGVEAAQQFDERRLREVPHQ